MNVFIARRTTQKEKKQTNIPGKKKTTRIFVNAHPFESFLFYFFSPNDLLMWDVAIVCKEASQFIFHPRFERFEYHYNKEKDVINLAIPMH
jgi:hypothetical protein